MTHVECPTCHEEFGAGETFSAERCMKFHHARTHGESLAEGKKKRPCPECGRTFWSEAQVENHLEDVHNGPKDPSECPTCDVAFSSQQGVKVHHVNVHNESIATVERTCENCGETFDEWQSKAERGRGRFCERACYHAARGFDVECSTCGKEIHVERGRFEKYENVFCGTDCANEYKIVHGRFAGSTYYGPNWADQRQKARERDNNQCRACGKSNEDHRAEHGGQSLHVHHISPFGSFDSYLQANRKENLVTLCAGCHNRYEGIPVVPRGVAR